MADRGGDRHRARARRAMGVRRRPVAPSDELEGSFRHVVGIWPAPHQYSRSRPDSLPELAQNQLLLARDTAYAINSTLSPTTLFLPHLFLPRLRAHQADRV